MRVLTVVLALAAMPFAAGLAQGTDPFSDPKNCGAHLNFADAAGARRADTALPHGGTHGVMDRPCEAPPACAVTSLPVLGTLSITGQVRDSVTGAALPNWCIQLFTDVGTATTVTTASGNYAFGNLPDATYVICEVVQSGWEQTFPTVAMGGTPGVCPTAGNPMGLGWLQPTGGFSIGFLDFRNKRVATP